MQEYKPSTMFGFLMVLSLTIGPLYIVLRGHSASRLEILICVVSLFPLGLLAMQVRHREQVRALLAEPDSESRGNNFARLKQEHHRIVLYGIVSAVLVSALLAWIMFVLMPLQH